MKLSTSIMRPLFFFCFLTQPLLSHICIDVDEFVLKKTRATGLRISVFDTDTQAYKYIRYHPHRITNTRVDPTIVEYEGLRIDHQGNIMLPATFSLENYILRTKGTFTPPKSWKTPDYTVQDVGSHKILYKNINPKGKDDVLETLKKFTSSKLTPVFKVVYDERESPFTAIVTSDPNDNNDERGIIGEIATSLTMISFGWFTHYPAQNGSNQGLDGAFLDPSSTFLFLTESKCRDESCTAENYLNKDMSEKKIHSKLSRKGVPTTTKEFITKFMKETPQNVLKGAHRIKSNGESQWAIESLDLTEHTHLTLSPQSSEKDAIVVLKSTVDRAALSQEKALDLYLQALNLTPEQAINMLQRRILTPPVTPISKEVKKEQVKQEEVKQEEVKKEEVKPVVPLVPAIKLPPVSRRLSFSDETPETKLPSYSYERLKKLVEKLENKLSRKVVAGYVGCDSRTVKSLLDGKKINTPEKRWNNLVENIDTICADHKLDKVSLFSELT